MEKIVFLIVKSYYDGEGNLIEVCPVVAYSSKSVAERSLCDFKLIEDSFKQYSNKRVFYEIKVVEII